MSKALTQDEIINVPKPKFSSSDKKFTLFQGDCNELLPKFKALLKGIKCPK